MGKLKDKLKEKRERKEAERKFRKRFYESLVDEVDNWVYGITYKDFSGLIQFYKENKEIYLKFSKYYLPKIKAVKQKWGEDIPPDTKGWIEKVNTFMYLFEIREKLAALLNEASILYDKKDFERALIYYKECIEGRFEIRIGYGSTTSTYGYKQKILNIYESVQYLGSTPFAYRHYGYHENREFYDSLDKKRKQVWDNLQKILKGEYIGDGTWSHDIEDMYETKLKHFLEERIFEIESELETVDYYKRNIDYLNRYLNQKKYNQAFNYYIKSLSYKDKIINKDHFLDKEKEKKIEKAVKNIILKLSNIIKRTVLDLSTKFTRLEIKEIREKCEVDYEDLIIKVIKEMIKNKEVYAEYFKSSNSISFNQQVNIAEIDKLMDQYRQWEGEGISKKQVGILLDEEPKIKENIKREAKLQEIEPFSLNKESSASRKKYEYFVNLGKNYHKSKQYQEALNNYQQARSINEVLYDVNLTIEIDDLIKQTEKLIDREQKAKEEERREAQIISFRGAQIPRFEANILQEIEKQLNKQFKKIDISMFKRSEVHMGFSVENQRITGIGLFECFIGVLPESIGKLKSLQELDLGRNELTTLPESIIKLKSLQVLSLINNKLNPLPESITKLKSLQSLYLGWNQLRTLPESIVNLSSLKSLWLPFNQLTTLPESISKLTTLKRLNLCNNPLARKPDSRTKSILKQLKKNNIDISL